MHKLVLTFILLYKITIITVIVGKTGKHQTIIRMAGENLYSLFAKT